MEDWGLGDPRPDCDIGIGVFVGPVTHPKRVDPEMVGTWKMSFLYKLVIFRVFDSFPGCRGFFAIHVLFVCFSVSIRLSELDVKDPGR